MNSVYAIPIAIEQLPGARIDSIQLGHYLLNYALIPELLPLK